MKHHYLATTARGVEPLLREELTALGAETCREVPGGVTFKGEFAVGMRACLWSRTATKVLLRLIEGNVNSEDNVYAAVRRSGADKWFDADHTLAVSTHLNDERFTNSHFLSLRIKDAIIDAVRDRDGRRPSVDTRRPNVAVQAYVIDGRLRVYLAMHGRPLFQRGYRQKAGEAPLKETLAAAVLKFAGWATEGGPEYGGLVDPMCGSGTFPIEAALMSGNIAPGLYRTFGFQRWPGFDAYREEWAAIHAEAAAVQRPVTLPLFGHDIDANVLSAARKNAEEASVEDTITFTTQDIGALQPLDPPGLIITNAPYGERIGGEEDEVMALHERVAAKAKQLDGHTLCILSTNKILKRTMRMRPDKKMTVFNGRLQCQVAMYSLGKAVALRIGEKKLGK